MSTKNLNDDTKNMCDEKAIDRRRILGLATAGLAGMVISKIAQGQQVIATGGLSPKSPVDFKEFEPFPILKKSSDFLAPNVSAIGMKRTGIEKQEWDKIEKSVNNLLNVTEKNTLSGDLQSNFRHISHGFKFQTKALDSELIETHIEPLLDQASDLLERCLKDRTMWDELSIKMFNLAIELNEFKELDKIHQEEEAAGLYEFAYELSAGEYNSEYANWIKNSQSLGILDWLKRVYFEQNIWDVHNANVCSAWLGGLVPYSYHGQSFAGYGSHTYGSATRTTADHHYENMDLISRHNLFFQRDSLSLQRKTIENEIERSDRKLSGLKSKAYWDKANIDFQKRRTLVSRSLEDLKAKAAVDADGVLNYSKRLSPLKVRFENDFRDALARIKVVERGLKNIYGVDFKVPANETDVDFYDKCLLWSRQVTQWIIKFSRNEQNTIYPLSLKQILTESSFKNMRERGLWSFTLKEKHFPDMCNIRLRGISLSVRDDWSQKERLWRFKIIPPAKATIRHFITKQTVEYDQSFVEPSILGRVVERDSIKVPDIVGITSLYNASPLGTWKIKSLGSIPLKDIDKIDDVQIDFHLAFRWFTI